MEVLEIFLHSLINLAILLFEYIGVLIIAFAGIQGVVNYVRGNPETRLILAKGLAMGLEFKLGGEILRTVIVNSLAEIAIVAGIIVLRATLTVLIHWEIKNEQQEKQEIIRKQNEEAEHRSDAAPDSKAAAEARPAADSGNVTGTEPAANSESAPEATSAADPESAPEITSEPAETNLS